MKDKFLKIAKCKDGASFYKKYPTEESFFIAHPEAKKLIPKADGGSVISQTGAWWETYNPDITPVQPDFIPIQGSGTAFPNPSTGISKQLQGEDYDQAGYKGYKYQPSLGETISKYAPAVENIIQGIQDLGAEKKALKKAEQQNMLTSVQAKASGVKDVDRNNVINRNLAKQRQGMMPIINANELFPTYGVGTNVLAKNGAEIQNTFAPGTIYDDLGYTPLTDNSQVKQFQDGGEMPYGQIADFANNIFNSANGGPNAGGNIGGTVGELAGTALGGPLGGAIGKFAGNTLGSIFDKNPQRIKAQQEATKRNQGIIAANAFANNFQTQNSAFMENGGNLTNPQLITKFGEYDVKDLLAPDPTMNTLRAGGHLQSYTPPTEHAMEQYAMEGELQTHWGGYVKPISYNPYSPGSGITYNAYGQSHEETDGKGNSGIGLEVLQNGGISNGKAQVEIERGEPIQSGDDSFNVFGNLYANMAGEQYKNKKFKNIVADLSKNEAKQNKIISKSTTNLDNNPLSSTFDVLAMNSNKMMMMGANSKLKNLAEEKTHLAQVQNAINETAAEYNLLADDLAKGKATIDKKAMKQQAKNGKLLKAQNGVLKPLVEPKNEKVPFDPTFGGIFPNSPMLGPVQPEDEDRYGIDVWQGNVIPGDKYGKKTASSFTKKEWNTILDNLGYKGPKGNKAVEEFLMNDPRTRDIIVNRHKELYNKSPWIDPEHFGYGWAAPELLKIQKEKQPTLASPTTPTGAPAEITPIKAKTEAQTKPKQNVLGLIASQLNPLFRQPVKNPLDANQLMGENFALTHNQVEPVQANLYNPQLITPYDISLQDQLNEITSSFGAAKRQAGMNPAAQAAIAGQEALAKQKVLGEQFRMNQGQKAQVYNQNIATLNDAKLKNLGILDQQYVRQNQAKSNAQALTQAALSSISDKIQKNKLETYGMNVYANQYPDYTFNNEGMLRKLPTFHQFDIPTVGSTTSNYKQQAPEGFKYTYNEDGTIEGMKKEKAKNGSIVKSFKSL